MATNGSHSDPRPHVGGDSFATRALHADEPLNRYEDVAPAMHVSTTFRYPDKAEDLVPGKDLDMEAFGGHIYSRLTAPNTTRLEKILSSLVQGHALTYSSGLSAFHAALVLLNPKRLSMGDGYHGCHGVAATMQRLTGMKMLPLDCGREELQAGDVIHLETPLNPTGEAYNIAAFAEKAHSRGAYLVVDATFGPPGLQDPFLHGADIVMHSGTKYIGGHSDMLCGVLAVKRRDWLEQLKTDRLLLGSVMGSFEGWLGVRSIRTLEIRVQTQSKSAELLVSWLDRCLKSQDAADGGPIVRLVLGKIAHASLQHKDKEWLSKQMPNGYGPVFSIWMKSAELARSLPSKLRLFQHATSLGGVESLIEWRTMSDDQVEPTLLRVSVGIESFEDLQKDLLSGFKSLRDSIAA